MLNKTVHILFIIFFSFLYSVSYEGVKKYELSIDRLEINGDDIIINLTVNTDFAQTEVDQRLVNLTRFPLFFPEKRDFFLDGATFFNFYL